MYGGLVPMAIGTARPPLFFLLFSPCLPVSLSPRLLVSLSCLCWSRLRSTTIARSCFFPLVSPSPCLPVSLSPCPAYAGLGWSRLRSTTPARPPLLVPAFFPLSPRLLVPLSHLQASLVPRPSFSVPRPSFSVPRPSLSVPRPSLSVPRPSLSVPRPSFYGSY